MQTPDRPSQGCTEPHASATRSAVQSRQPSGGLFQQTKQQRTIDKLRKKLTKERKRRSKIQGKLKLSQEQSLQLQEALNAANKENERLETAREAQVLHKTNFTKPLHIPRLEHQQLAQIEEFHNHNSSFYKDKIKAASFWSGDRLQMGPLDSPNPTNKLVNHTEHYTKGKQKTELKKRSTRSRHKQTCHA